VSMQTPSAGSSAAKVQAPPPPCQYIVRRRGSSVRRMSGHTQPSRQRDRGSTQPARHRSEPPTSGQRGIGAHGASLASRNSTERFPHGRGLTQWIGMGASDGQPGMSAEIDRRARTVASMMWLPHSRRLTNEAMVEASGVPLLYREVRRPGRVGAVLLITASWRRCARLGMGASGDSAHDRDRPAPDARALYAA
jgi:hypothetical protein